MGARSTGNHPTTTEADGHLLKYFRQTFGAGGGASLPVSPSGMIASGGVISDYSTPPGDVYRAHVFTSTGTFDVTTLGTFGNTIDYLVVAGGGSGSPQTSGSLYSASGGGGAGGLRTSLPGIMPATNSQVPVAVASYNVVIGAGGAYSSTAQGNPGTDTSLAYNGGTITSNAGGGGGETQQSGLPGGSGGGQGGNNHASSRTGGAANPNSDPTRQGYPGTNLATGDNDGSGGGGGGAGAAGQPYVSPTRSGLTGGAGVQVAIAGPTAITFTGVGAKNPANNQYQYFAGGGGGGGYDGAPTGVGGVGGGGRGENPPAPFPAERHGQYGTGGGGGGAKGNGPSTGSGSGGSGIVIVRYKIASITASAKATGGAVSFHGGKTIHTFTSSGDFTVQGSEIPSAEIFVVAGGGGGGGYAVGDGGAGGGGAGGLCVHSGRPLAASTAYPINIGAGGAMAHVSNGHKYAVQGTNTVFTDPSSPGTITSVGGGFGRGQDGSAGGSGGSGGGGSGGGSPPGGPGGPGTQSPSGGATGYGNDGGAGQTGPNYRGGGGGGAGVAGADGPAQPENGPGGYGRQAPPSFRDPASTVGDVGTYGGGTAPTPGGFWFAGGGGASGSSYNVLLGTGGAGGGGQGYLDTSGRDLDANTAGKTSTGGGGGGYSIQSPYVVNSGNANGGSGIVLIAYPS